MPTVFAFKVSRGLMHGDNYSHTHIGLLWGAKFKPLDKETSN